MVVHIVAQGAYCENVTAELPELKQLVHESVGKKVQRIGRFIQLALIGAGRASAGLSPESAIYLSSGRGDMGPMVEVFDAIYRAKQSPRPLSFVNTVSNAACFHVMRTLELIGASNFIGSRYFSFEMGLKTAWLELQVGRVSSALVGVVDSVVAPVADHCQRLGLAPTACLAEGSHWLQLVTEPGARQVLASVQAIQQFGDSAALSLWLTQQDLSSISRVALGQYMSVLESDVWLAETGLPAFVYAQDVGHFDSQAGRAITQFLEHGEGGLLYINRDPHGRYMAIVLEKPQS